MIRGQVRYPGGSKDQTLSWNGSRIAVWEDPNKTVAVPSGTTFVDTNLPKIVWVEGVADSNSWRDTTVVLTHNLSGLQDKINLTVVDVNLVFDGVADPNEEDPGAYISVNWSDDDGDGWAPNEGPPNASYTPDKDDPNVYDATKAPDGDRDLRSLVLNIEPNDLPSKVRLTYSAHVAVWQTKTKRTAVDTSSYIGSGTEFDANDLPVQLFVEGLSGTTNFKDAELCATYLPCDANDMVKVTVFEVDLTGFFAYGGQQEDNEVKHSTFWGSSEHNGMISWDDANADGTKDDPDPNCINFRNCMECQGTVKPTGVTGEVLFNLVQYKWWRAWGKLEGGNWTLAQDETGIWYSDDSTNDDEDLTVSADDHIYAIDAPGIAPKLRSSGADYRATIQDFRQYAEVLIDGDWYQCSDYHKWHSKVYVQPKDANYTTRSSMSLQALGSGWVTVPNNP